MKPEHTKQISHLEWRIEESIKDEHILELLVRILDREILSIRDSRIEAEEEIERIFYSEDQA